MAIGFAWTISLVSECFSNLELSPFGFKVSNVLIHFVSVSSSFSFVTCSIGVTLMSSSMLSLCLLKCW